MKSVHLTIRLPKEMHAMLCAKAAARGIEVSEEIREALANHLRLPDPNLVEVRRGRPREGLPLISAMEKPL